MGFVPRLYLPSAVMRENRHANLEAWKSERSDDSNKESSMKKISVFINKCRSVSASSSQDIMKDVPRLRLDKYETELGDALSASATKIRSPSDILAFVQVISSIHCSLRNRTFSSQLISRIIKALGDENSRIRANIRIVAELYLSGLLPDSMGGQKLVLSQFERGFDISNCPPSGFTKLIKLYYRYFDSPEFTKAFVEYTEKLGAHVQTETEALGQNKNTMMLTQELENISDQQESLREDLQSYHILCTLLDIDPVIDIPTSVQTPLSATPTPSSSTPIPRSTPNTSSPVKSCSKINWWSYEQKLTTMTSPESVQAAVEMFSPDSSTLKKLQQLFVELPRIHMLPFYAQFLKGIQDPQTQPTIDRVTAELIKRALDANSQPNYLRFLGELTKSGVLSASAGMDILIQLARPQIQPQSIFTYTETCGEFLGSNPETRDRVINFRDFIRQAYSTTPQDRTVLEGAISYLLPSSNSGTTNSTEPTIGDFVQALIFKVLNRSTYTRVLKLLKKLRQQELFGVVPVFTNVEAVSTDNLNRLAQLVSVLTSCSCGFGFRVLDSLIDDFTQREQRLKKGNVEYMDKQSFVCLVLYLGHLQAHGLLSHELVLFIFERLIRQKQDPFRLKLACLFISSASMQHSLTAEEFLAPLKEYREEIAEPLSSELAFIVDKTFEQLESVQAQTPQPGVEEEAEEEEKEQESGDDQDEVDEEDPDEEVELEVGPELEYDELELENFEDKDDFEKEFMLMADPKASTSQGIAQPPSRGRKGLISIPK